MAEKKLRRLNIRGAYCYGIKLIIRLIGHYGYDLEEWRELLEFLCYFTSHKDHNDMNVWREKLGLTQPDCEDIPDKGFGEIKLGEMCFDCSFLING